MDRRDLIFRVFVSSTFSDLKAERDALQEKVFPELREYCQQRGARFQAIDLRWGVSQEAALDQQTMNICFQELKRCQELSPKPNFIVLLGQRYGWVPLPAQIEATEFEELWERIPTSDRPLLCSNASVRPWRDGQQVERIGWYRKDLNAVPAEYVLQPRMIDFPENASDDDRKRIRREEAEDWARIETRMRTALQTAVAGLPWPPNDPRRFKYLASATHQEIQAGALEAEDPQNHVLCCFREITNAPTEGVDGWIDTGVPEDQLDELKRDLGEKLPEEHIMRYQVDWDVVQVRNSEDAPPVDVANAAELSVLCGRVRENLQAVIDREIDEFEGKSGLDRERQSHREFAEERSRHFVGRADVLERLSAYLADPDATTPLVIHGKSGSGKTALMAKAALDLSQSAVVSRFIGATPGSSDLRSLLTDLCRDLGVDSPPQDMNELVRTFRDRLSPAEQREGRRADSESEEEAPPRCHQARPWYSSTRWTNSTRPTTHACSTGCRVNWPLASSSSSPFLSPKQIPPPKPNTRHPTPLAMTFPSPSPGASGPTRWHPFRTWATVKPRHCLASGSPKRAAPSRATRSRRCSTSLPSAHCRST